MFIYVLSFCSFFPPFFFRFFPPFFSPLLFSLFTFFFVSSSMLSGSSFVRSGYSFVSLFIIFFEMTTWPSGLRRVTRNHFSSGGVGSNPAVVVFILLCYLIVYIKRASPGIEPGPPAPKAGILPLNYKASCSFILFSLFVPSLFSFYSLILPFC